MGITFRNESNDGNYLIIDYSYATVPSSNHAVKSHIRFFRVPSAGVLALFDTVINDQSFLVLPSAGNQTRLM